MEVRFRRRRGEVFLHEEKSRMVPFRVSSILSAGHKDRANSGIVEGLRYGWKDGRRNVFNRPVGNDQKGADNEGKEYQNRFAL